MPPREPKKPPSRFASIPPGASFEDDVQLDELRQPWSLTFGEFLRLVQERYGFTLRHENEGYRYLLSPDGRRLSVPAAAESGQLNKDDTAYYCWVLGLPPSDFGLPAEDAEEGDDLT